MIVLELVVALLLGGAVLWLLLAPLLRRNVAPAPDFDPVPVEETRRGQALVALNEIEFDHATGKLSDEDYADLRRRHGKRALAILEEEEGASQAEERVARQLAALDSGVVCPDCGPRPEPDARYCSSCGHRLGDEARGQE